MDWVMLSYHISYLGYITNNGCVNPTYMMVRYDVVISSDVARTRTNGCIFFKLRDPSVDVLPTHYYSHKFVCVAPYNTDTLLLINIPKTMLEKVIKVRGIQSH